MVKYNFTFDFDRYRSVEETIENIIFRLLKRVHVLILYTKKERVVGIHLFSFTGKESLLAH